jgi:type IV pilus assembly protein PilY1
MVAKFRIGIAVTGVLGALASNAGFAQTPSAFIEDFTRGNTTNSWYYFGGACLTAGTAVGTGTPGGTGPAPVAGQIPSCISILSSYYATRPDHDASLVGGFSGTLPDPVLPVTTPPTPGDGALRFTNGSPYGHNEAGAIVSSGAPFNAGQGVQILFKTVTYRGDGGGASSPGSDGKDGADGMSFYLLDATASTPGDGMWNGLGSFGGSLGYTCSNQNSPYTGVTAGYIGLGMDEFGNFLNGQNLSPNAAALQISLGSNSGVGAAGGDNTASGYGYWPGRLGLRGAGSVSWPWLNTKWSTYYPSSVLNTAALQAAAVQQTCKTGQIWDYRSNPAVAVANPISTPAGLTFYDYAPIASATGTGPSFFALPASPPTFIANETATTRPDGVAIQNVFVYSLKITQDGLLTFSYSMNGSPFTPVITNQNITASNGPLPSQLYFGFAGSTGGDTNIHEILCFKATPVNQSASSAAGNEKQTATVVTGTQAYFAFYNPNDWTGTVASFVVNDTAGALSFASSASWDASCWLTGPASTPTCPTTLAPRPAAATPTYTGRVMMTWNGLDTTAVPGNGGIAFEYGNLVSQQQTAINLGDSTFTNNRTNYLRGQRSNEITSSGSGLYRARDAVLSDIVDSSPVWVGPPNSPYSQIWRDNLNPTRTMPENSGQSYTTFQTNEQSRLNVVYVGANDGFLHGFRAGTESLTGVVSPTSIDGQEVLAYMPGAVVNTIHNSTNAALDLANTQYAHNFFVDATPGFGDVFYQGAWHTWMVGGLGAGGQAIYALDITNPQASGTQFSEANAANVVKFEVSSATITCQNVSNCGANLGNTYGTPQIRRFHNGMWGAVFGNGYGSSTGDAGIFVMVLNPGSGSGPPTPQFYYLSTSSAGGNGIAYVTTADLDGDHVTDFVYAGDLKGNIWRFDLTSFCPMGSCPSPTSPGPWAVTAGGPLFKATIGTSSVAQPITAAVVVAGAAVTTTSTPQVIVGFGSGQRNQFTNTSAATYISGSQSIYGVWDWNFSAWNALPLQGATYASLTSSQMRTASGASSTTLAVSNLQQQAFTISGGNIVASNTPFTYATTCTGSGGCAGKFGWWAALISTNGDTSTGTSTGAPITEQVVAPVSLFESAMIFNSVVPVSPNILSCETPQTDTGITYALNILTGGTFNFGSSGSPNLESAFVNYRDTAVIGLATNETGAGSVLSSVEDTNYVMGQLIAPTATQPGRLDQINLPNNITSNRQTWVQLR